MDLEFLKVLAPYFTSVLGSVVAIGIAIYNNSSKTKAIQSKLTEVDHELHGLKENHFFHLGEYLKKLNAFLRRGKLMDDVEKADMDSLADGVAGKKKPRLSGVPPLPQRKKRGHLARAVSSLGGVTSLKVS